MKMELLFKKQEQFKDKIRSVYPSESEAIIAALQSSDKYKTFRITDQDIDLVLESLHNEGYDIQPTKFDNIYICKESGDLSLSRSQANLNHEIYIQDLSSMLPVLELQSAFSQNSPLKILDMCAAPGSKTSQLSFAFPSAEITAVEKDRNRFFTLRKIIDEFKLDNVKAYNTDAIRLPIDKPDLCESFDIILLDAPCSSEGTIRLTGDKQIQYWNRHKYKDFVNLQKRLLSAAIHLIKPGGTILYSTCTFSIEENEGVVDWNLNKYENVEVCKFENKEILDLSSVQRAFVKGKNKEFDSSLENSLRVLPTQKNGGFYMAKLQMIKD